MNDSVFTALFAKVVGFPLSIRILGGNTALKSHQGVSSLNWELVDIEY